MNNPLVSVIVPCYNQAQYLGEALQSILDQTYTHWECIIVNDGSPDDTHKVAQEWLAKDARFKYIQKENGGLSSARNAGIESANGDWIQLLDCDDVLHIEKFERSLELLKDDVPSIVISNFNMFKVEKGTTVLSPAFCLIKQDLLNYKSFLMKWDVEFNVPIHCGIFHKTAFETIRFNEQLKAKEDWLFWIQVSQKIKNFHFLNDVLAYYRTHDSSMTKDKGHMNENTLLVFKEIKNHINSSDYDMFVSEKLRYYYEKMEDFKNRHQNTKKSNTYQFGLICKKIMKKIGLFAIAKPIFEYINPLK
jgi:glycosyltransferase involved in cell wall biosynthesis